MVNLLFAGTVLLIMGALCEGAGAYLLAQRPLYQRVRAVLQAKPGALLSHRQHSASQPYLLYVANPGFERDGLVQHNSAGYRGDKVPVARAPERLRVLFLGGSTTYTPKVRSPSESYPAATGRHLESRGHGKVEVINGGLLYGTTAELLTHYLLKYRYYRPDLVVINTGGNDAQANVAPQYHPDYSHWRQQIPQLAPLPPGSRWLLSSRFVSFVVLRAFYSGVSEGQHFVRKAPPAIAWYDLARQVEGGRLSVPRGQLAFENNLGTLVREIQADGGDVLLVPFRANPDRPYGPVLSAEMTRHEEIMRQLANDLETGFAAFPGEIVSAPNWLDNCHVNAAGANEKAAHVAESIDSYLRARE